jgi:thiamine pyrophosphokinase
LERWFAFRHQGLKLNLKKVILAVVSGESHSEITAKYLKTFFEMYHGIIVSNLYPFPGNSNL